MIGEAAGIGVRRNFLINCWWVRVHGQPRLISAGMALFSGIDRRLRQSAGDARLALLIIRPGNPVLLISLVPEKMHNMVHCQVGNVCARFIGWELLALHHSRMISYDIETFSLFVDTEDRQMINLTIKAAQLWHSISETYHWKQELSN